MVPRLKSSWQPGRIVVNLTDSESGGSVTTDSEYIDDSELSSD